MWHCMEKTMNFAWDCLNIKLKKTRIKLRHVLKALKHASKAFENEDNLTWRDACNQAVNESLGGIDP